MREINSYQAHKNILLFPKPLNETEMKETKKTKPSQNQPNSKPTQTKQNPRATKPNNHT
jgi:hypothetical protein